MIVSITIRGLPNYCLFVLFLLFSRYILLEHDFDTDAWLLKKYVVIHVDTQMNELWAVLLSDDMRFERRISS